MCRGRRHTSWDSDSSFHEHSSRRFEPHLNMNKSPIRTGGPNMDKVIRSARDPSYTSEYYMQTGEQCVHRETAISDIKALFGNTSSSLDTHNSFIQIQLNSFVEIILVFVFRLKYFIIIISHII